MKMKANDSFTFYKIRLAICVKTDITNDRTKLSFGFHSIILTLLSLYMIYYVLQYIYTHVFNYNNTYIHLRLIFAFLAERLAEKGFSDTNKKV